MNAVRRPDFGSSIPTIPEDAPFSPAQRAWLNGFFAGLYGGVGNRQAGMSTAVPAEDFPWHDPSLEMDERLQLAAGRPFERRLMAAMAQLDCGQCGYLCQTYAEALASGRESSASLCVPGAKPTSKMLKHLLGERPADAAPAETPAAAAPGQPGLPVRVLESQRLTADGSAKDVRHVRIDLSSSGVTYEPGDTLAILAHNDPAFVDLCLTAVGAGGGELVPCPDGTMRPVREAFAAQIDIARPLDQTLDLLAMSASNPADAAALRRLAAGEDDAEPTDADLLDLLEAFPSARPSLTDLVRSLPSLKPRLYSIASSPRVAPGEVHLCVSVVDAERRGRRRPGVASHFLAHRASGHGEILAHVQASHFRLPADPAIPVIMIGPGTGIAPFRAFLQERAASGHTGQTWLFFGDQHEHSDFLFRSELAAWLANGTLSRLETAWSRDQPEKIYVQHRMLEHAAELWRWLQDGAHLYVCGDATRMARDVDLALRQIAVRYGGLNESQAKDWTAGLARQGRYKRDVYS